ncbi:MAG: hypothetical protein WBN22_03820, partial [Verrucomicrobiia bacterium]
MRATAQKKSAARSKWLSFGRDWLGGVVWGAVGSAFLLSAVASPVYPVKISANGRYLMDQNNVPFLMVGDAPHSLVVNLSSSNAAIYLADRAT